MAIAKQYAGWTAVGLCAVSLTLVGGCGQPGPPPSGAPTDVAKPDINMGDEDAATPAKDSADAPATGSEAPASGDAKPAN